MGRIFVKGEEDFEEDVVEGDKAPVLRRVQWSNVGKAHAIDTANKLRERNSGALEGWSVRSRGKVSAGKANNA